MSPSAPRLTIKLPARPKTLVTPMAPPQPVKLTVPAPNVLEPLDMTLNVGNYRSDSSRTLLTAGLDDYRLRGFYEHADRVILDKSLDQYARESAVLKNRANFEAICECDLGSKQPPIAVSTVYLDSTGVPIFAYFANRLRDRKPRHDLTQDTQYDGRTPADVAQWGPTVVPKRDEEVLGVNGSLRNAATTKSSSKPQAVKRIMHDGILVSFTLVVMISLLTFFPVAPFLPTVSHCCPTTLPQRKTPQGERQVHSPSRSSTNSDIPSRYHCRLHLFIRPRDFL